jgi:hypothetical protein
VSPTDLVKSLPTRFSDRTQQVFTPSLATCQKNTQKRRKKAQKSVKKAAKGPKREKKTEKAFGITAAMDVIYILFIFNFSAGRLGVCEVPAKRRRKCHQNTPKYPRNPPEIP